MILRECRRSWPCRFAAPWEDVTGRTGKSIDPSDPCGQANVGQTKELTAEDAEVAEARTEKSTNARMSIGQLVPVSQLCDDP